MADRAVIDATIARLLADAIMRELREEPTLDRTDREPQEGLSGVSPTVGMTEPAIRPSRDRRYTTVVPAG